MDTHTHTYIIVITLSAEHNKECLSDDNAELSATKADKQTSRPTHSYTKSSVPPSRYTVVATKMSEQFIL